MPRSLAPLSRAFSLLLSFVTAIQTVGTLITVPALPMIADAFGASPGTAQLTLRGYLVGVGCGQIVSGAVSDRIGRRPVLLAGTALFALTGIGCALATSIDALIALRTLQGFGSAAGMILVRAIVRDLLPAQRALGTMAFISSVLSIALVVGAPLSSLLLQWTSWRWIFAALAALGIAAFVLTYLFIAESLSVPDKDATKIAKILANCRELLCRKDSMGFIVILCVIHGGFLACMALIPYLVPEVFAMNPVYTGQLQDAAALAVLVGTLLSPRLLRRWAVRRVLTLAVSTTFSSALLTFALCLASPRGVTALYLLMIPFGVYCASYGVSHSINVVLSLQPLPHVAGTASALGASFQSASGALFPLAAVSLYNGSLSPLGLCIGFSGLAAFAIFMLHARAYAPDMPPRP